MKNFRTAGNRKEAARVDAAERQKANEVLAQRKALSEQAWVRRFQEAAFAVMLRGAATRLAKKGAKS